MVCHNCVKLWSREMETTYYLYAHMFWKSKGHVKHIWNSTEESRQLTVIYDWEFCNEITSKFNLQVEIIYNYVMSDRNVMAKRKTIWFGNIIEILCVFIYSFHLLFWKNDQLWITWKNFSSYWSIFTSNRIIFIWHSSFFTVTETIFCYTDCY